MKTTVLNESGYREALLGLSLSYNRDLNKMESVADKLAFKGDGHGKFLESMVVWLDITAPRYWWSQVDTYRVGVSKQSESTMHTILKREIGQSDFERDVHPDYLEHLNNLIKEGKLVEVKQALPESFLQRRIVCLNYATLQRIERQRRTHKLPEWQSFCDSVLLGVKYPKWVSEKWKEYIDKATQEDEL